MIRNRLKKTKDEKSGVIVSGRALIGTLERFSYSGHTERGYSGGIIISLTLADGAFFGIDAGGLYVTEPFKNFDLKISGEQNLVIDFVKSIPLGSFIRIEDKDTIDNDKKSLSLSFSISILQTPKTQ